jgi:hypothetical protein
MALAAAFVEPCTILLQGISLRVREEKCTRRPGRCSYTLVQVLKGNKVGDPDAVSAAGRLRVCRPAFVNRVRCHMQPCAWRCQCTQLGSDTTHAHHGNTLGDR